jgi:hypothetical protein
MDTEYRTMYNLFDGAVYEDFVFYSTRKLLCGKTGSRCSPFYASARTRTNCISFPGTDPAPKNRKPVHDQHRLAGKTGRGISVSVWCTIMHSTDSLWCKTSRILTGPDCSCVQMPGLSENYPPKVFFLPENLVRKFPGLKKIPADQRKTRKTTLHSTLDRRSAGTTTRFCTTDRTGHARSEMPATQNISARNFTDGKIFGLKF